MSLTFVAELRKISGDYEQSERLYRQALGLQTELSGPESRAVADILQGYALTLQEKGDYEKALELQERALAVRRDEVGKGHPDLGWSWAFVATARQKSGDLAGAEQAFRVAVPLIEKKYGRRHRWFAQNLNNLAHLLNERSAYGEAAALLDDAIEIQQAILGSDHPDLGFSWKNLGAARFGQGDLEAAEQAYDRGLEVLRGRLGEQHPAVAKAAIGLAAVRFAAGDLDAAEALYRESLAVYTQQALAEHPKAAEALAGLGRLYVARGEPAAAEPLLLEALAVFERKLYPGDARISAARRVLDECQRLLGGDSSTGSARLVAAAPPDP